MPRAALPTESLPRVVPASPEVAQAVHAWLSVRDGDSFDSEVGNAQRRAWMALEDLLLETPLLWHRIGEVAWGVRKVSKRGYEVKCRSMQSELQPTEGTGQ
jgi:hypothetical protein